MVAQRFSAGYACARILPRMPTRPKSPDHEITKRPNHPTRRTFLAGTAALALATTLRARAPKVRVGVCTRDVAGAVQYGFEYIEPAAADIAAMSEDDFRT